ncbi:MAG: acetolactate synthase small subunit [Cocleimonas sp.]|nr:acetolactate synthase small subunit [Cocleimonas sp.]
MFKTQKEEKQIRSRHILSLLMENETGALSRVSGLFSQRGYNIESLTVAPTDDPTLSRMTLVTKGNDASVEQIVKQLNKLIDIVKVMELSDYSHIEREIMFVKVAATNMESCASIKRMADIFRANVIDVKNKMYTIEITGRPDKLDGFLETMEEHKIIEVVRSGAMGITRGSNALKV